MKVLLVKTSSLGDVIHALPAVTDAITKVPGLTIDWVVEENFSAIPERHPGVKEVLPLALRRWRHDWIGSRQEIADFFRRLRNHTYDLVIDSQGLIKSSLVSAMAKGPVHGYDRSSAREGLATILYSGKHAIARDLHAITRQKQLIGACLDYVPGDAIDYGLSSAHAPHKRVMLFHGTTWRSKEWPEFLWKQLVTLIRADGYEVLMPAGNPEEKARAVRILGSDAGLLEGLSLAQLMDELVKCVGAVSVDTGLGHLAPALSVPVVGIFGATDPALTGIRGVQSKTIVSTHLPCIPCRKRECRYQKPGDSSSIYPPCYEQIPPETVWQALRLQIGSLNPKTA